MKYKHKVEWRGLFRIKRQKKFRTFTEAEIFAKKKRAKGIPVRRSRIYPQATVESHNA